MGTAAAKRKPAGSTATVIDGPAAAAASWEIRLGPLCTRYRLDPDATAVLTEKFSDVLRHAGEFGETWPSSPQIHSRSSVP